MNISMLRMLGRTINKNYAEQETINKQENDIREQPVTDTEKDDVIYIHPTLRIDSKPNIMEKTRPGALNWINEDYVVIEDNKKAPEVTIPKPATEDKPKRQKIKLRWFNRKAEAPKAEAPKVDTPKAEAPKAEEPKPQEAPKFRIVKCIGCNEEFQAEEGTDIIRTGRCPDCLKAVEKRKPAMVDSVYKPTAGGVPPVKKGLKRDSKRQLRAGFAPEPQD